jgi:hypothetical protein
MLWPSVNGYVVSLGKRLLTFDGSMKFFHLQCQAVEETVSTPLTPFEPEEEGITHFRNVRKCLPNEAA